jgi:hypothetical protein
VPTDTVTVPAQPATSLTIALPYPYPPYWRAQLIVHAHALLTVTSTDAHGHVVPVTRALEWNSNDSTVAQVSSDGVVTGLSPGTVTITVNSMGFQGRMELDVRFRVKITPPSPPWWIGQGHRWYLGLGDTLQLGVSVVDADGIESGSGLGALWSSSDPEVASVSPDGLVIGSLSCCGGTEISVLTAGGADTVQVGILDLVAGMPATVRYTHAATGLGPVTFLPNKGAPVTLAFGESLERPLPSGAFYMTWAGLPTAEGAVTGYATLVREGDHLSLIVAGDSNRADILPMWTRSAVVASDSIRVRLAGYTDFGVIYHVEPDTPAVGIPWQCYFDGGISDYFVRAAGGFDFVLKTKFGEIREERARVSAPAGRSATFVVTGDQTLPLLMLLDP